MNDSARHRDVEQQVTIALGVLTAVGVGVVGIVMALSGNVGFGTYLATLGLALLVVSIRAVGRGIPDGRPPAPAWKGRLVIAAAALVLALVFYLLDR